MNAPARRTQRPSRPLDVDLFMLYAEPSGLFHKLVAAAGLDKTVDFRDRDLRGVHFDGADLSGFDFSRTDLRGTVVRSCRRLDERTKFTGARLDSEDHNWVAARERRGGKTTLKKKAAVKMASRKTTPKKMAATKKKA